MGKYASLSTQQKDTGNREMKRNFWDKHFSNVLWWCSMEEIRSDQHRYPFCVVWTPIPLISWLFPFIGHIGIATSKGIIRDFAGNNYVSEDNMAFGWPTIYYQLKPEKVNGGAEAWDRAVSEASDEYKHRLHNLFLDNCHSHVSLALNTMRYDGKTNWNNFRVAADIHLRGKFVSFCGFLRQFLPFSLILLLISIGFYSISK